MDFKFDEFEEIEEEETNKKKKKKKKLVINKTFAIIIVIIIAIIVGGIVFYYSSKLFVKEEKKEEIEPVTDVIDIENENVSILYQYVTYGVRNKRNNKFIKEKNVTQSSFTEQEKYYYALQFAQVEDFKFTNNYDEEDRKIYSISTSKIKEYMERFFGGNIEYKKDVILTYPFSFRINGLNVGNMKYVSQKEGYQTVFTELQDNIISNDLVNDYYAKLDKAINEEDGTLKLFEKIIFTELEKNENNYNIKIYKDYNKTKLITTLSNLSEEDIKNNPIKIDDYLDVATIIEYEFRVYNNYYYFYSSTIKEQ